MCFFFAFYEYLNECGFFESKINNLYLIFVALKCLPKSGYSNKVNNCYK